MTIRLCKTCRDWHDPDKWPQDCMPSAVSKASTFPAPRVIGDTMPLVQSQADGKYYDSKTAIRAHYRAAGVVEMGTDRVERVRPAKPPVEATVAKALQRVGL